MNRKNKHRRPFQVHSFAIGAIAGIYPLFSLYAKNFTLINTWEHFFVFLGIAILIPGLITFAIARILKKKPWVNNILTALNVFFFLALVSISIIAGVSLKWTFFSFLGAMVLGFFLAKHLQKILVFELLLGAIACIMFVPKLYQVITHPDTWKELPDTIAAVEFIQTPNIYVIQPDGYANSSQLSKGYYNIDNTQFEGFLESSGFSIYENFRSNYDATLSSNSSLFAMKHHYYQGDASNFEVLNARKNIVSKNPVLSILKKNTYTSYFVSESAYLLLNRPPLGFDEANIPYHDIPYLSSGFQTKREVLPDVMRYMADKTDTPKFFFIQILNPKHIDGNTRGTNLAEKKRLIYLKNVEETNQLLVEMIEKITEKDPNALIVLLADHGGYVGLEYLQQGNEFTQDADKINSIFSTFLAIRWPSTIKDTYANRFKTNVNFFRILFAHLAEKPAYLDFLEEDASFININKKAPAGVYKCIDEEGKLVFEKL